MIILVDLAQVQRLPGSSGHDWSLRITIFTVYALPSSILAQLSHTAYISALLGHGCENTNVGAIIVFLCLCLRLLATEATQLGRRVPHTGKHDIRQLLLAQTLIGRVEDRRAGGGGLRHARLIFPRLLVRCYCCPNKCGCRVLRCAIIILLKLLWRDL